MKNRIPERCQDFRELLERALCEPAAQLQPLAWHEHLNVCPECRSLLEEEEALEHLLASLPEPRLPETLVERVLTRLREEHAPADLDTLLDHYDYLRQLVGADHIGIGADFTHGSNIAIDPARFSSQAALPWPRRSSWAT